ncbi:MAG: hypothetical protein JRH20_23530 [Deltaproteobacteria bacterium]|nr:hypothetical protein [Deltaproteobacteria bacterium]
MLKQKHSVIFLTLITMIFAACGEGSDPERGEQALRGLKADAGFTCEGVCGGQATAGCWCDEKCTTFGDCCPDKGALCDARPTASCQDACGGQSPDGCWCDAQCTNFGDCCSDKTELCQEETTCEAAGGKCGALTATGVQCDAGYELDAEAGTCGLGGSCCMPKAEENHCVEGGGTCVGVDGTCEAGSAAVYTACGSSSDLCCMPDTTETTCEAAGGKCGALTMTGVQCDAGMKPAAGAGTCGLGGSCCMPEKENHCVDGGGTCIAVGGSCEAGSALVFTACATSGELCCMPETPKTTCEDGGGKCMPLTADGVRCEEGWGAADVGMCAVGAGCCVALP